MLKHCKYFILYICFIEQAPRIQILVGLHQVFEPLKNLNVSFPIKYRVAKLIGFTFVAPSVPFLLVNFKRLSLVQTLGWVLGIQF